MQTRLFYIVVVVALLAQNSVLAGGFRIVHPALDKTDSQNEFVLLARNDSKKQKVSVSKGSAKSIALSSVRVSGARAVSVKLVKGSRPYYKVRLVLPDGKVKNVQVDAMSGSVR